MWSWTGYSHLTSELVRLTIGLSLVSRIFARCLKLSEPGFRIIAQRQYWCPIFDQNWQSVAFYSVSRMPLQKGVCVCMTGMHLLRCRKELEADDS